MRDASPDPLIGTTVSHYHITAKLGGGGMGVVYAARDLKLPRRVALKLLPPQWSHDEDAKERLLREAQAASSTDHRNICTVHDIDTAPDGRLFIVMAHYDGPTLKQRLATGALTADEAIEIAAQIAEGLSRAHAQGIVHRDIKPGNLILTDDGVRILDFGLARFAGSLQLTIDGSTIGTFAYMSPEQARGDDADARSDVWAVGVVLFEMITGRLPFRGAYPEAIATAIRSDPTPPLGVPAKDGGDVLDRIVGRALAKDPAQRYQSAREMARDLRLVQGHTLPMDLRTEPVRLMPSHLQRGQGVGWRLIGWVAAVVAVLAVAAAWALFAPIERVAIAVAPVVNQTGYAELDPYRLALTRELIGELTDSPALRVLPYDRLLQIIRRFRVADEDISSRESLQAIAEASGAALIVVPALQYENGAWKARMELRRPASATTVSTFETPAIVSSLVKNAAYSLAPPLAAAIERAALAEAPVQTSTLMPLRRALGFSSAPNRTILRNLDAAAAFAAGLEHYERQEYVSALKSFDDAARADTESALARAWQARTASIVRQDREAADAATSGVRMLTDRTPPTERQVVEAIAAEVSRDTAAARDRLEGLVAKHPDDPAWMLELASFQDRQTMNADAVTSYLEVLRLDPGTPRAHLDLCRMYNRLQESVNARTRADQAVAAYSRLGDRPGEAQALMCRADARRTGSDDDRTAARADVDRAAAIFEEAGLQYNLARALNYNAMIAGMQGRRAEAATYGDRALEAARAGGNLPLQPLVLMNLGVTHEALGQRTRAIGFYADSAKLYEQFGDEVRAAQILANRAALRVDFGDDGASAIRDLENASAVFRKLGDLNFEVMVTQVTAAYQRYAGRLDDAETGLRRGLALAQERSLRDDVAALTIDLARTRLEAGDAAEARRLLLTAIGDGRGPSAPLGRICLAQAELALGNQEAARSALQMAAAEITQRRSDGLLPLLHLVEGQLALAGGNRQAAREALKRSSDLWTDDLPDAASVEARGLLGFIEAEAGRPAGREALRQAMERARAMGRVAIESRCRQWLNRLEPS